jgi:hypothetical protein
LRRGRPNGVSPLIVDSSSLREPDLQAMRRRQFKRSAARGHSALVLPKFYHVHPDRQPASQRSADRSDRAAPSQSPKNSSGPSHEAGCLIYPQPATRRYGVRAFVVWDRQTPPWNIEPLGNPSGCSTTHSGVSTVHGKRPQPGAKDAEVEVMLGPASRTTAPRSLLLGRDFILTCSLPLAPLRGRPRPLTDPSEMGALIHGVEAQPATDTAWKFATRKRPALVARS